MIVPQEPDAEAHLDKAVRPRASSKCERWLHQLALIGLSMEASKGHGSLHALQLILVASFSALVFTRNYPWASNTLVDRAYPAS